MSILPTVQIQNQAGVIADVEGLRRIFEEILVELKKMNMKMSILLDDAISERDLDNEERGLV